MSRTFTTRQIKPQICGYVEADRAPCKHTVESEVIETVNAPIGFQHSRTVGIYCHRHSQMERRRLEQEYWKAEGAK